MGTEPKLLPCPARSLVLCLYTLHLKLLPALHVRMAGYGILLELLRCLLFC